MSQRWRIAAAVGVSALILGVIAGVVLKSDRRAPLARVEPVLKASDRHAVVMTVPVEEPGLSQVDPAVEPVQGAPEPTPIPTEAVSPPLPPAAAVESPALDASPAPVSSPSPTIVSSAVEPPPAIPSPNSRPAAENGTVTADDPEKSARDFVEKTRKEAEAAKIALEGEAKKLRARLRSVESALDRWESLISALERDGQVRRTDGSSAIFDALTPAELGRKDVVEAPRQDTEMRTRLSISSSSDLPLPDAPALEPIEPDAVEPTPTEPAPAASK